MCDKCIVVAWCCATRFLILEALGVLYRDVTSIVPGVASPSLQQAKGDYFCCLMKVPIFTLSSGACACWIGTKSFDTKYINRVPGRRDLFEDKLGITK